MEAVKTINLLLNDLAEEDYQPLINYVKMLAENRKRQRKLESIAAMNEFQSVIGSEKGWANEEEMLKDMADFRRSRASV